MKKCPFCAEEIQDEAIKCKHCSEFLDESKRPVSYTPPPLPADIGLPWYFRNVWIIIVVLSIPPFGLPMVWLHPKFPLTRKVLWTIVIIILTWIGWLSIMKSIEAFTAMQKMLDEMSY